MNGILYVLYVMAFAISINTEAEPEADSDPDPDPEPEPEPIETEEAPRKEIFTTISHEVEVGDISGREDLEL